jgi:hypothetical protein
VVVCILVKVTDYLLFSENLYYNAYAEQLTYEQISKLIKNQHRWQWLNYIILPIFYLLKFALVASCLGLGLYLATNRWVFKPFFEAAIKAEFVLLIPSLIKILWFLFVQTDYTLNDLQFFYPLSLINIFEPGTVEPYLLYPLQVLNLFEVAYWFALAYGVARVIKEPLEEGFKLVMASYGSGLVLWVAFVMFLTVSLS